MPRWLKWTLIGLGLLVFVGIIASLGGAPEEEEERARERETTTTEVPTTTTERATTTTISQEELKRRYAQQILPLLERLDAVYNELGNILDDVVNGVITPEEGADRVRAQRDEVADIRQEAVGIIPPADLEDAHDHFLRGLDLLIQSLDRLALGLEQQDPSLIDEATVLLGQSNAEFEQFAAELEENLSMQPAAILEDLPKLNRSIDKTSDSLSNNLPKIKDHLR